MTAKSLNKINHLFGSVDELLQISKLDGEMVLERLMSHIPVNQNFEDCLKYKYCDISLRVCSTGDLNCPAYVIKAKAIN